MVAHGASCVQVVPLPVLLTYQVVEFGVGVGVGEGDGVAGFTIVIMNGLRELTLA
jgi:hypothetical protein